MSELNSVAVESPEKIYKAELFKICQFVLADEIPSSGVDVLFFHGRAWGDEGRLLDFAARALKNGQARQILLPGYDGQIFRPDISWQEQYGKGLDKYKSSRGRAGFAQILDQSLMRIDSYGSGLMGSVFFTSAKVLSTKQENEALLDYVLEFNKDKSPDEQIKRVALLAHPHQLPRAILGMVKTLLDRESELAIFTAHPLITAWNVEVKGSQGKNSMSRRRHAREEIVRVPRYQKTGDLASADELLAYYQKRDGSFKRMEELLCVKQTENFFQRDLSVLQEAINALQPNEV